MDYIYSELSASAVKVEYTGKDTSTTSIDVNNSDSTISVDVKPLSPDAINAVIPSHNGNYIMMLQKLTGTPFFTYSKELPEEIVNNIINANNLQSVLQAGSNISIIPQEPGKLEISASLSGVVRFSTSTLLSVPNEDTTQLLRSNIIGGKTGIEVGDAVIFPDKDNLVTFIGTTTTTDETSITVGDIKYLNNVPIMKGEWKSGKANYPEEYTYNGYVWLCLKNEIEEAPTTSENWQCLGAVTNNTLYYSFEEVDDSSIVGQYQIQKTNIQPPTPAPKQNDIIIFAANNNNYVGQIVSVEDEQVTVEKKLTLLKTSKTLYTHLITLKGQKQGSEDNYTVYFTLTNTHDKSYVGEVESLIADLTQEFIYPAAGQKDGGGDSIIGVEFRGATQFALHPATSQELIILNSPITISSDTVK